MSDWKDFRDSIKRVNGNRIHKIHNSYGVYDAYKLIRKLHWFNIGRPLTEHEFYSIIRKINNYLVDELIKGNDVIFPNKMGRLDIRKNEPLVSIKDGKLINPYPIDWDKTLKLWYEDEEAFHDKIRIYMQEKEVYKIHYDKVKSDYINQSFFDFFPNRNLKIRLKQNIRNGNTFAFRAN